MAGRIIDLDYGYDAFKRGLLKDMVYLVGIGDSRVASYAGKHELGINTKKRSFLVSTLDLDRSTLIRKLTDACDAGLFGGMDARVRVVAEEFKNRVRQRILGGEIRPATNDGQPTLVESGDLVRSLIVKESR